MTRVCVFPRNVAKGSSVERVGVTICIYTFETDSCMCRYATRHPQFPGVFSAATTPEVALLQLLLVLLYYVGRARTDWCWDVASMKWWGSCLSAHTCKI